MARKDTLVYELVAGQSLAASFNSEPTVVRNLDNFSYQINISTTDSTGSFAVEVSNDYSVNPSGVVVDAGNWTPLVLAGGTPVANAANDTIAISLNQLPFYAVRLAYTSTLAGTGTCDVYISSKQIGG